MLDIRTGEEMSRRDFGKGIAAILASGCAPSVMGGMMRMTGAKNTAVFGGKKYTVNDYIRPSSVFLFDGIENLGFGQHGDTTSWVSLVGSSTITSKLNGSYWTDKGLYGDTLDKTAWASAVFSRLPNYLDFFTDLDSTIEVVFSCDTSVAVNIIMSLASTINRLRGRARSNASNGIAVIRSHSSDTLPSFYATPNNSAILSGEPQGSLNGFFGGGLFAYAGVLGMRGTIHAVRGYTEYLSDDVIDAHYAIDKARFNLP